MTKASEVFVKLVPQLPEAFELPSNGDVPIYDPNTNVLKRIKAALLGGGTEIKDSWIATETYDEGVIKEFQLKLWLSLLPNNLGNTPIEGSSWWVEVSRSTANGFGYWAPGVFTVDPSMVLRSGGLFYLDNQLVSFPFNSTDFEAEYAQNKWVQVAGSGSGGGFVWNIVNIDSAVTTDFNAVKNTIYLVDCTTAPVIARLPNVVAGNVDEFKFILQKDTHKLTITTVGGTQTICDDTSQIIATIGGGMQFKANAVDHYCLVEDTRILTRVIEITEDRDFSMDGFENHILYIVKPNGGQINLNIPAAFVLPGSIAIQSRFQLDGAGSFAITAASGLIGNAQTQVVSTDGDGFDITWSDLKYYVTNDTRPKVVSSSITTYSLNELTAITDTVTGTFFRRRAASTEDSDFDPTTPPELSVVVTANPTDPWQVIGSSIIQGAIIGIVPDGNTDIFYNVRRTGVDVYTYVAYYKRTVGGVETLISQSVAGLVNSSTAQQLRLTAQHDEFSMVATDYYVVRTFARKATTGTNPTLISILEGSNPTRSTLEIPASAIAHNTLAGRGGVNAHPGTAISIDASGFNGNLTPLDDTLQKVAQKFDDYVDGWTENLTAWTTPETTVNLTSNEFRDFGTNPVTVTVNIILSAVISPKLAEYAFKFVFGTGGSFIYPVGIALADGNPTLVNNGVYEANIVRGKLIYKKV